MRTQKRRKLATKIGCRYGKLLVIGSATKGNGGRYKVTVECDCGTVKDVQLRHLENGATKSCGCLVKIHGLDEHPLSGVWRTMKARCNSEKSISYKNYGEKGITVCDEWEKSLSIFVEWAENNGWVKGLQIDREDSNKNYTPDNCRFVTAKENQNNRANNRKVKIDGVEKTIAMLAEEHGISYQKLYQRLFKLNWPIEKALIQNSKTIK